MNQKELVSYLATQYRLASTNAAKAEQTDSNNEHHQYLGQCGAYLDVIKAVTGEDILTVITKIGKGEYDNA